MLGDVLGRRNHERQIRLTMGADRRRHTDDHHVDVGKTLQITRRFETVPFADGGDLVAADVLEIALTPIEYGHLIRIDVKAEGAIAGTAEGQHKRQPDVPQTHETDHGLRPLEPRERVGDLVVGYGRW